MYLILLQFDSVNVLITSVFRSFALTNSGNYRGLLINLSFSYNITSIIKLYKNITKYFNTLQLTS